MNPIIHSENSMKKFHGKTTEDFNQFLKIHEKMDCSKAWVSDNRHRVLTHTMFWVKEVMLEIFGSYIVLSDERKISVKDICEQHILEDYRMKFIPTPQDFIQEMDFKDWMQNGKGTAPSAVKLYPELKEKQSDEGYEDKLKKYLEQINPNPPEKQWPELIPDVIPNPYKFPTPWDWGTKIID